MNSRHLTSSLLEYNLLMLALFLYSAKAESLDHEALHQCFVVLFSSPYQDGFAEMKPLRSHPVFLLEVK
jgi:hypothetical protein